MFLRAFGANVQPAPILQTLYLISKLRGLSVVSRMVRSGRCDFAFDRDAEHLGRDRSDPTGPKHP